MPNWCSNEIHIHGSEDDIKAFKKLVESDTTKLDFNQIIPMPKELEDTKSPCNPEDEEVKKLIKKYGYGDWYKWRNANWGVKWNTHEVEPEVDNAEELAYFIDTPWSPPSNICQELRNKFPELEISWFYREDGMKMSGYL